MSLNRILYLHVTSDLYGGSRCLLNLIRGLDRDEYKAIVVLPSDGPLVSLLKSVGARVIIERSLSVIRRQTLTPKQFLPFVCSIPFSTIRMAQLIRRERIAVVHSNVSTVLSGALAARLCGVPHVWHVREALAQIPVAGSWYRRLLLWSASHIFCTSNSVKEQFREDMRGNGKKIDVLHDGLDLNRIDHPLLGREEVRRRFGVERCEHLVACVGRIGRGKGQQCLLRAYALARPKIGPSKLLIVGDAFPGNESVLLSLQGLVRQLDLGREVIFTGFLEDVASVLGAADTFVMPSTVPEGYGMVLLEAMAAGVPVIATNAGGPLDIIEDGKCGLFVHPGDGQALAAAMCRLAADEEMRARFRAAGRARVETISSPQIVAEKVQAVYRGLIGPEKSLDSEAVDKAGYSGKKTEVGVPSGDNPT